MKNLVRCIAPLAFGLAAMPAALHAQTVGIQKGGNLTITVAGDVNQLFNQQNINVSYIGSGPTKRGEVFNVTGGAVNLSTGSGSAQTQGSMTFTEGNNTVTLNKFFLLGSSPNAYITADVVVNGQDQGRFSVFLLATNLYMPPLSPGKYDSGPVRFTINPDFQSEFADYIPIQGLDPNSPIGVFNLSVVIKNN